MKQHQPRKRFGQNFLIDAEIVAAIIGLVAPRPGDHIVEIGPGLGALTGPLLAALQGGTLEVIELDRDLVRHLEKQRAPLVVHAADALRFDFASLAGPPLRLVGNLPYNISSPLLFHLTRFHSLVRDQHFMLQDEVVERMTARAGSSAYGRLSVMLAVLYAMDKVLEVPATAFDPPPKVRSAVVRMVPLGSSAPAIDDHALFALLVMRAFGQRRKMLRNALAAFDDLLALDSCGLAPDARAEDIEPGRYVAYANALARAGVAPQSIQATAGA